MILTLKFVGKQCAQAFSTYPVANCILYHEPDCDDTKGTKEMGDGDTMMDIEKVTRTNETFEVESVSVREGCELIVHTGDNIIKTFIIRELFLWI